MVGRSGTLSRLCRWAMCNFLRTIGLQGKRNGMSDAHTKKTLHRIQKPVFDVMCWKGKGKAGTFHTVTTHLPSWFAGRDTVRIVAKRENKDREGVVSRKTCTSSSTLAQLFAWVVPAASEDSPRLLVAKNQLRWPGLPLPFPSQEKPGAPPIVLSVCPTCWRADIAPFRIFVDTRKLLWSLFPATASIQRPTSCSWQGNSLERPRRASWHSATAVESKREPDAKQRERGL